MFNFEDLCMLKVKSIVLSSTHSFGTLAFLIAPVFSFLNFYACNNAQCQQCKKADLAAS